MKKLKQLLIIAFVSVLTFSFAACSSTSSCGGSDATLTSLSVDSSGAKTTYYVGDSFSADGIVVTAVYSDETEVAISSDDYTLDSSSYVSASIGTYTIGISYTEGDITVETSYDVKVQLAPVVDLELNTSSVKTLYLLYQDISYSGLTATATYADKTTKTLTESDLTKTTYYDSTKTGKYIVIISYTYGGSTVSGTYYVEVVDISGNVSGLEVEKTTTQYTLSSTSTTVNIDDSDLSVYTVDDSGKSATALDASAYYLRYFKDGVELQNLDGVGEGLYQIYACVDYDLYDLYGYTDDNGGHYIFTASNWVEVYVLDTLESITLNDSTANPDGVYSQSLSTTDSMSPTWTFTATFGSGNTKQLTASDVTITGITTTSATTAGEATVSYTFTDALGNAYTKTCTVSYTVTGATSGTTTYAFSYDELTTAMAAAIAADEDGDKVTLAASYFTGSNAFLTYSYSGSGTSNIWRNSSNGSSIEIKDADLSVTFIGTGSISITFSSTGGTSDSSLVLTDASGNYITGTTSDADTGTNTSGTYYKTTGTSGVTVTFTISTNGTYYIKANVGSEGRAARIKAISMSDLY